MKQTVTLSLFILLLGCAGHAAAQDAPTPLPVDFPTFTPSPEGGATAPPTLTPTPAGLAYAEAIDEANVRDGPGIDFNRLGSIRSGAQYAVLTRHGDYPWIEIEFPDSPNDRAWVYRDLVTLTGNVEGIPIIQSEELPTQNPLLISMQETLEILTLTPGALGTATAMANLFPTDPAGGSAPTATPTRLPTYTPPPLGMTPQPFLQERTQQSGTGGSLFGLPPAVPIIGLIVAGGLGLAASLFRRLF